MLVPKISTTKQANFSIKLDKFRGGTATLINPARLPPHFAVESVNLMQDQDGIWRTRPGVDFYGNEIDPSVSSIDGITEYVRTDGTRELLVVAGGYLWKSTDNARTWTKVEKSGGGYHTWTEGERVSLLQINNRLFIANGAEELSYYDGTYTYRYTALSAPTNLSGVRGAGLSAGSFNNYYTVAAVNDVGMTTPATSINVTTNKDRAFWTGTTNNEYVSLAWNAVSGANGYQIYNGDEEGYETLIGTATGTTFIDYGQVSNPRNEWAETPNDNTTAGPKLGTMELSANILWGTKDPDNPYRVYFSGASQFLGKFSPYYGGGWVDVEYGGKNKPLSVVHFRTGKGDPITTVLASSSDGKGATYQVELVTTSIGETSITIPATYKIVGSLGTDAPFSVVKVADNIFYANKRGVYALRNKEQMFNVLSTDNLIQPIRDRWEGLNSENFSKVVAYFKNPYVFFSVPMGDNNDTTAIFDMERNNWVWAWNVGFKIFCEYTQSDGKTKFLAIPNTGNRIVEISDNYEGDYGVPFYQSFMSPIIPVSKDPTVLARIREVIYELGKFKGSVTVGVVGITKDKQTASLVSKTIETQLGTSGWGDDFFSDFLFSDTNDTPTTFTYSTIKKRLKVNKKLYGIQFKIYTTNRAYFELLSIFAEGSLMKKRPPSAWN